MSLNVVLQHYSSRPHLLTMVTSPTISSQPVCVYKQLLWCQAPVGDLWGSVQSQRCLWGNSAPVPAGFCSWPCSQCLFSLPSVFGYSRPCSSLPPEASRTLSHMYSHRKVYCTLYKCFFFCYKETGYTVYHIWLYVSVYIT